MTLFELAGVVFAFIGVVIGIVAGNVLEFGLIGTIVSSIFGLIPGWFVGVGIVYIGMYVFTRDDEDVQ